jgi:hypothetical protein
MRDCRHTRGRRHGGAPVSGRGQPGGCRRNDTGSGAGVEMLLTGSTLHPRACRRTGWRIRNPASRRPATGGIDNGRGSRSGAASRSASGQHAAPGPRGRVSCASPARSPPDAPHAIRCAAIEVDLRGLSCSLQSQSTASSLITHMRLWGPGALVDTTTLGKRRACERTPRPPGRRLRRGCVLGGGVRVLRW